MKNRKVQISSDNRNTEIPDTQHECECWYQCERRVLLSGDEVPSEGVSPLGASSALPPSRPRGTSRRRVHRSCESVVLGWGGRASCHRSGENKTEKTEKTVSTFPFLIHLPASKQSSSPENTCWSIFEQRLMVDAAGHVDSGNRRPPGIESHFSALEKEKKQKKKKTCS